MGPPLLCSIGSIDVAQARLSHSLRRHRRSSCVSKFDITSLQSDINAVALYLDARSSYYFTSNFLKKKYVKVARVVLCGLKETFEFLEGYYLNTSVQVVKYFARHL